MAFTWANLNKTGGIISIAGLQEMQDNCDYLDDNIACINEKSVDCTSNYTSDLTSNYTSDNAGAQSAINSAVLASELSTRNESVCITNVGDNDTYYYSDDSWLNSGYCSDTSCSPQYCDTDTSCPAD